LIYGSDGQLMVNFEQPVMNIYEAVNTCGLYFEFLSRFSNPSLLLWKLYCNRVVW